MANGKWQISNGFPFAICHLNFEFLVPGGRVPSPQPPVPSPLTKVLAVLK